MGHIHTGPGEHDPTASAYIVRLDTDEPRLTLHTHKFLNILLQPGGHIELNETPWQAVLHEILEETGYEPKQLKLLQPKDRLKTLTGADLHPYPVAVLTHEFPGIDHFHTDTAWAFISHEPPNKEISENESPSLQFMTLDEIKAIPSGAIPENVREIGIFVLENCLTNWERVPLPKG